MRRFSDAKAALPRKSDGGGAPSLPWEERARCRADLVRQHLVKKMVGTPRRRGPKSQARERRFWIQRRRCRKNRTAAARHPYLGERARCRAEEKGRHSESKREAGADRSGTGFFVSLLKSQAARVATTGFAVLRRFTKTYPPMPQRSRSEAATWPGSGTAADAASPSSFTHGVVANGPSSLPAQAEYKTRPLYVRPDVPVDRGPDDGSEDPSFVPKPTPFDNFST